MSAKQLKSKDINLLEGYHKRDKAMQSHRPMLKYAIPPLLLTLLFGSFYGIVKFQNYEIQNEIADITKQTKDLQNKLNKDPNVKLYQDWLATVSDVAYYKNLYETIDSYPVIKQGTFNTIANSAYGLVQVVSLSYARDSQIVSLQIESTTASGSEQYVRALKASDVFADVTYTGYRKIEKQSNSDNAKASGSDTSSDTEKILEYLTKQNNKSNTDATYSVYSATVLCTLK